MARVTHYKRLPTIGLLVAIPALAVLAIEPRDLPLGAVEVILAVCSLGLGTILPVTTVAIQNAVMPHQMGTATGTMNFFRSLGGALIVAAFGAIVLGGLPQGVAEHVTMETLPATLATVGLDVSDVFRWVFAAAALGLVITLGWFLAMEERPLKSRVHEQPLAAE
jgi:hypothetical protein